VPRLNAKTPCLLSNRGFLFIYSSSTSKPFPHPASHKQFADFHK
jgi:hypothetical protein